MSFLKIPTDRLAKSLVYKVDDSPVLDYYVRQRPAQRKQATRGGWKSRVAMEPEELAKYTGANAGSIGPIGLKGFKIIADKRLEGANELISGGNRDDFHITHIDLNRDAKIEGYYDLRTIEAGEPCPSAIINCES